MGPTLSKPSLAFRHEGSPPPPRRGRGGGDVKFRTPDEAWFWTMASLAARRDGANHSGPRSQRPFDPDDVVRCLDRLYRQRRIDLLHGRILRIWGERQTPPNPHYENEACDHRIWTEAMERLQGPLRDKGIVH